MSSMNEETYCCVGNKIYNAKEGVRVPTFVIVEENGVAHYGGEGGSEMRGDKEEKKKR